ncbi:hypothetical protein COOONC_15106 [Cooperia oncophora]
MTHYFFRPYFRCGRSGRYVSGGLKRPRPSTKQTRHCTCFLNVRVNEYGTVTVIGCFGHIGHKIDAALIRLSHPQEMFLKDQLEKYPVGYVLMRLKRDYSPKTSRLYHVTGKELRNIMKRYHLEPVSQDSLKDLAPEVNSSFSEGTTEGLHNRTRIDNEHQHGSRMSGESFQDLSTGIMFNGHGKADRQLGESSTRPVDYSAMPPEPQLYSTLCPRESIKEVAASYTNKFSIQKQSQLNLPT